MRPRLPIACAALALGAGLTVAATPADDRDAGPPTSRRPESALDGTELSPIAREKIAAGLAWLARQQAPDGHFGGTSSYTIACTGLAGLAFLAGGHVPDRGPYGGVVRRAADYLIGQAAATQVGYLGDGGRMYSHGFAALFLAELEGMCSDAAFRRRVGEALRRAIALLVATQDENGGWWYEPTRDSGDQGADISVTICEVMALRAAQAAGVEVPRATVARATALVKAAQWPEDGGFAYRVINGQRYKESNFARTAAGVCILYHLGEYDAPELRKGLAYLDRELATPGLDLYRATQGHYQYAMYYATLACFQWGGEPWARHFPRLRDDLLARQQKDGSWPALYAGGAHTTAMSLVALQVPLRYLPILQR